MLVVVATRPDAVVPLGESIRYLYEHFREVPRRPLERLDVLLIGGGLASEVGARVASLLREYARELNFLLTGPVGAGETLCSLAGDSLIMHPMATLTTVLPRSGDEAGGAGLDSLVSRIVMDAATENAPYRSLLAGASASALGDALHRLEWVRGQLRNVCASRLNPVDDAAVDELFEALTRQTGRVGEPIARRDARRLGAVPVEIPTPDDEHLAFDLHIAYEQVLDLLAPTSPAAPRAIIESTAMLHTLAPHTDGDDGVSYTWQRHFDSAVH